MINFEIECNDMYFKRLKRRIEKAHIHLHTEEDPVLNWVNHPINTNVVLDRLNATNYKKFKYNTLVIVGAGGSINSSRAILNAIKPKVKVIFLGDFSRVTETLNNIVGIPLFHIMSQSGNTLETSFALSQIIDYLREHKLNETEHLFISTSNMSGYLYKYAKEHSIQNVITPNSVGRLSALSSHLINIIFAHLDIKGFIEGAKDAYFELYSNIDNPCYRFAVNRLCNQSLRRKYVEIVSTSNTSLDSLQDWYCQLFSESEGKDGKGALPIKIKYPEHLHSYEQFFQQGKQMFYETMFVVKNADNSKFNSDNPLLSYMNKKTYDEINNKLISAINSAHKKVKIPINTITLDTINEYNFGYLFYFFHKACVMCCMLQKINPYTQNGVDNYKKALKNAK